MKVILGLLASVLIVVGGIFAGRLAFAQTPSPGNQTMAEGDDSFWRGWTIPVNVSQSPTNQATWPTMDVSDGGQRIYLAWSDGRGAFQDIYFALSIDGGGQWSVSTPVLETAANSLRPSLVLSNTASGTTPLVAWADASAGLNHTIHQWTSGVGQVEVPNDHSVLASAPHLALGASGESHLALHGGLSSQADILYTRRDSGMTEWPTTTVVFTHTQSGSLNPAIAVSADGQSVHLVWQEDLGGGGNLIYYVGGQRDGDGMAWGEPISLSMGIESSVRPAIVLQSAVTSPTIHVVWGEQTAGFREQYIRYTQSSDGGVSWSPPVRVVAEPVSANNIAPTDIAPALTIAQSGALCVAWHGFRSGVSVEAEEIYLSCSTDGGASWSRLTNVSRSPAVISIRPVLKIGNDGILHVAWQELAGGGDPRTDYQIYYAHNLPYIVMFPVVGR